MKRRYVESSSNTPIKFTLRGEKSKSEVREHHRKERTTVQEDSGISFLFY